MTDLPSGWASATLHEIAETSLGKMLDAKQQTGVHPTPYLRNINVRWGGFDLNDIAEMDIAPHELDRVLAVQGDVIACEGGEPGRAAVWRGEPIAIQKALHRIRPAPGISPDYLAFGLRAAASTKQLDRLFTGTTIKHLPQEKLRQVQIPLAPYAEQERIVAAIEEAFSKLDVGEAGLLTVRRLLKRMREATLLAAVTGRLCQLSGDNAVGDTELESLRETSAGELRPRRRTGPAKDSDVPVPGVDLPAGWRWVRWSQVGHCQNGRAFPSTDYRDHGVPLLRPGNLAVDGHVRWSESNTRYLPEHYVRSCDDLLVGPAEVVMNLTAQSLKDDFLGRACITGSDERCLLNQRLARLTPFATSSAYALLFFRSPLFRDFVKTLNTGSLIQHMYTHQVDSCWIPLPPPADQDAAVVEADRSLSVIANLERIVETAAERGAALRRSVLKAAFEGRLVPQDPSEEPALVLLERICAERAASDAAGGRRRKKVGAS